MSKIAAFALATSLLASQPVIAADEVKQRMFNNMAHEAIQCVSYFMIMSQALKNSPKLEKSAETAIGFENAANKLLGWAIGLSKEAGLKLETVQSRLSMEMKGQMARIDKNTSNISILMADYNEVCVEVASDPKKRVKHWLNKEFQPARPK